jgi:transmembrane sensor
MNAQEQIGFGSAEDIEKQAALWIDRQDRPDWNAEDQSQLEAWLSQSLSHSIAFWRLNAAWRRAERLAALRPDTNPPEKKKFGLVWARTAAVLTLVVLLGAGAFYVLQPQQKIYSTPLGGRQTLTLADGSSVDMNTDTTLRISTNAAERKVWLDKGEAFFRIKHDSSRPFTIIAASQRITDLGTAFFVRREDARIRISLVEGSARVEAADANTRPVVLKPGDVAMATPHSIAISRASLVALNNELGWRRGVLVFYDTPLAEAALQFDRYSAQKIVVVGTAAAIKIGGTFPSDDPVAFAAIAKRILHVQVNALGKQIVISR